MNVLKLVFGLFCDSLSSRLFSKGRQILTTKPSKTKDDFQLEYVLRILRRWNQRSGEEEEDEGENGTTIAEGRFKDTTRCIYVYVVSR